MRFGYRQVTRCQRATERARSAAGRKHRERPGPLERDVGRL